MNKPDVKKLILLNLPYVFAFNFADKIATVFRLAPGTEFIDKLTNGFAVFGTAFANPLPSFHPVDLLIGLSAGVLLKLAVYVKGKNCKKFRQGEEYGSARWGKPEDIKPYTDPEFANNVILTQTEFLTMNSRPKQPKYARNKNILVIGGSGSGKTRFFVKPNLMQMHSSYTFPICARPQKHGVRIFLKLIQHLVLQRSRLLHQDFVRKVFLTENGVDLFHVGLCRKQYECLSIGNAQDLKQSLHALFNKGFMFSGRVREIIAIVDYGVFIVWIWGRLWLG